MKTVDLRDRAQPVGPPRSAERLDRLPMSRWLGGVMVVLFLGWLVESYDVGLTGSVLPSLTHLYGLGTAGKSLVATAPTIGIVAGIVPAGWLADRYGRKQVLVAGTLGYAVLTFVTGLAGSVSEIVALRVVAGLAMGAVFPLPYAYGAELCPPAVRGRFTGIADSFLSVGYFASPLLALFLVPSVTSSGWRTMFFIGGLPVVFAAVAWRVLPESPRWYEDRGRWAESEEVMSAIERRVEDELGQSLPALAAVPTAVLSPTGRTGLGDLWRGDLAPAVPGALGHLRRDLLRLLFRTDLHADGGELNGLQPDLRLQLHRHHRGRFHPRQAARGVVSGALGPQAGDNQLHPGRRRGRSVLRRR